MNSSPTVRRAFLALISAAFLATGSSCSITSLAVRTLSSSLSAPSGSGGPMSVFLGEEDPQIVADSLPTLMKGAEALSATDPTDPQMSLLVGTLYVMYANAFVEGPASMLDDEYYDQKAAAKARAELFYIRGAGYAARSLELQIPGITKDPGKTASLLKKMGKKQVGAAYWYAAGICSAFSLDPLNVPVSMQVPVARDLAQRALELDPGYSNGALIEFFLSFHAGMPDSLGGDKARVKEFFDKAVAATGGTSPGPYLTWATAVDIPNQDAADFRANLQKALDIDPAAHPDSRLMIILSQRKARWYLDHIDDFILSE